MSKAVIKVAENFTIRKIDPKVIAEKFFNGEYVSRKLPQNRVKSSKVVIKMGKNIQQNATAEVYQFKDRNNNYQTVCTTNHALYSYVSNENTEIPILKCKYCKRGNLKNPIGLPIAMEIDNEQTIFHVIDTFCDFGCAFSFLKRKNSESRLFRNSLYMNAEQMLYCFYYKIHPDKVGSRIKEKPDWDLLRENGGPLTDEEFDSETAEYIPISSLVMLPSKRQYVKLNLR